MINIRNAHHQDIPSIQKLAHAIWPDAYASILSQEQLEYMLNLFYSTDALNHQMQYEGQQFVLLEDDSIPKGFASYTIHPSLIKLNKLYVLPASQGKGYGKKLLQHIRKICHDHSLPLLLNVNRNNIAIQFYKSQGFSILKEEDVDIGNNYFMNDYIMEWKP